MPVAPPPLFSPLLDPAGTLVEIWRRWFQDVRANRWLLAPSFANTGGGPTVGQLTLVAGTKIVTTTAATATCLIFFQRFTAGGTVGNLSYTKSNGVSFTVTSDNAADTSVVNWLLVETHS